MNSVRLQGTLTKEPYTSAKGWMSATLAVQKEGTDYKPWIPLYIPAGSADAFRGAQRNEPYFVEGELDEFKDKEGNKRLQVKVTTAQRIQKKVNKIDDGTITDDDIPF